MRPSEPPPLEAEDPPPAWWGPPVDVVAGVVPVQLLLAPESPDFNLWRNMMREYSEEFRGNPQPDGSGDPVDYANQEPFRTLDAKRQASKIRVCCLGAGIDA